MESEELKALSFIRRSLLRKSEKLRSVIKDLSSTKAQLEALKQENEMLKAYQWRCADLEKEVDCLHDELKQCMKVGICEDSRHHRQRSKISKHMHTNDNGSMEDVHDVVLESQEFEENADYNHIHVKHERMDMESESYCGGVPNDKDIHATFNDGDEAETNSNLLTGATHQSNCDAAETSTGQNIVDTEADDTSGNANDYGDDFEASSLASLLNEESSGGSLMVTPATQVGLPPLDFAELKSCPYCGFTSSSRKGLRSHVLRHSRGRPHRCHQCRKSFSRPDELRRHLKCHTGEKPFSCVLCRKPFGRKDHLQKHMNTVHLGAPRPDAHLDTT